MVVVAKVVVQMLLPCLLLPAVCCLLPAACCLLPAACWLRLWWRCCCDGSGVLLWSLLVCFSQKVKAMTLNSGDTYSWQNWLGRVHERVQVLANRGGEVQDEGMHL